MQSLPFRCDCCGRLCQLSCLTARRMRRPTTRHSVVHFVRSASCKNGPLPTNYVGTPSHNLCRALPWTLECCLGHEHDASIQALYSCTFHPYVTALIAACLSRSCRRRLPSTPRLLRARAFCRFAACPSLSRIPSTACPIPPLQQHLLCLVSAAWQLAVRWWCLLSPFLSA